MQTWDGVTSGSFDAPDHDYPSHLRLELKVTDSSGLTNTKTVDLQPKTGTVDAVSDPAGIGLSVGKGIGIVGSHDRRLGAGHGGPRRGDLRVRPLVRRRRARPRRDGPRRRDPPHGLVCVLVLDRRPRVVRLGNDRVDRRGLASRPPGVGHRRRLVPLQRDREPDLPGDPRRPARRREPSALPGLLDAARHRGPERPRVRGDHAVADPGHVRGPGRLQGRLEQRSVRRPVPRRRIGPLRAVLDQSGRQRRGDPRPRRRGLERVHLDPWADHGHGEALRRQRPPADDALGPGDHVRAVAHQRPVPHQRLAPGRLRPGRLQPQRPDLLDRPVA